jgi:toxin ParE1/3/4
MKYKVFLIADAEEDIFEIYNYVAKHDSPAKADKLFENLKMTCLGLESFPERGHTPPELERINLIGFSEIHFKPYRIIYQIRNNEVYIHCVLDGRRELQELLEQRLLR